MSIVTRKLLFFAISFYLLSVDHAFAADTGVSGTTASEAVPPFGLAPFVAHAVEGEAHAVGIGRITADDKEDVVLVTQYHPITQIRDALYLFEQGSGGILNPPVDQGIIPAPDIFEAQIGRASWRERL